MSKKQKVQVVIAATSLILIIFWLFTPGWERGKIVSILSSVLLLAGMAISYFEEEKRKKS